MAEAAGIGSIVVVDCGTVMTKAVLLDRVCGGYHFVARGEAPTTLEFPWSDLTVGVGHALERIREITHRVFFDAGGRLITPEQAGGQGVDVFAATVSASQPLRVVLAGLAQDLSLASGLRAATGIYCLVEGIIAPDGLALSKVEGMGGRQMAESHVRLIRDCAPDVVCIVGGVDGGATTPVLELAEATALACSMIEGNARPRVIFAGNAELRERVVEIVGERAELRVADNVRPTLDEEHLAGLQAELESLYLETKMGHLPGIGAMRGWSPLPPVPTASSFGRLVQYLWYLEELPKGTLGVDIGAANTTVAAVFDGHLYLTVRTDLGMAYGGRRLLEREGGKAITRWTPEAMSEDEARGLMINKELRPVSIPQEPRELWLEQAVAREMARAALASARERWRPGRAQPHPQLSPMFDPILVGGGVLAHAPRPGQAALMVLDALEPIGVSTLVLDAYGLAPALGSVAAVKPLAAVEALDAGGFVNLGTVVAPVGRARRGDIILKLRITYPDGGTLEVEVPYGSLEVLPLPPGQQAVLELRPLRRFDVGLGGPGRAGKRRVNGGLVGLIVDARGRPLRLPAEPAQCQAQVQQWLWDVGG